MPHGQAYTTLSHCWDTVVPFKFTKANYSTLQATIPSSELPKTFQDAVTITRDIGVEFLWIDSLCIIQDSREDWNIESTTMSCVYSNSYCNISATASADGNGGCTRERNPSHIQPLVITQSTPPRSWSKKVLTRSLAKILSRPSRLHKSFRWQVQASSSSTLPTGSYAFLSQSLWKDAISSSPLNSRGWVLQERVLSPRILYFGSSQLFFECPCLKACETYPIRLPNFPESNPFSDPDVEGIIQDWTSLKDTRVENWEQHWGQIVKAYSKSKLSRSEDKLVAISGLAERTGSVHNTSYLAGLFSSNFIPQLLWRTYNALQSRPTERAPSWSWASVHGEVCYFDGFWFSRRVRFLVEVLETRCETVNDDPFGEVTSAFLQLRGQLLPATLREPTPDIKPSPPDLPFALECKPMGNNGFFHTDAIERILASVFCLPVIAEACSLEGLVLEVQQTSGRTMRRVGVFFTGYDPEQFIGSTELFETTITIV